MWRLFWTMFHIHICVFFAIPSELCVVNALYFMPLYFIWCSHLISLFHPDACMWFSIDTLFYTSTLILSKWWYLQFTSFVMFLNFYVQLLRDFIVHNFVLSLRSDFVHPYLSHFCCYCMFVLVRNGNIKMFNQSSHVLRNSTFMPWQAGISETSQVIYGRETHTLVLFLMHWNWIWQI